MPNNPYPTRPPITDPATVAAWADYERASSRAHRQYLASPIACAWGRGAPMTMCRVCLIARCYDDVCATCRVAS